MISDQLKTFPFHDHIQLIIHVAKLHKIWSIEVVENERVL